MMIFKKPANWVMKVLASSPQNRNNLIKAHDPIWKNQNVSAGLIAKLPSLVVHLGNIHFSKP